MENLKLSQKLSPKLIITPQLKQALYILQLPHVVLKEYLIKQISENPLLQLPDGEKLEVKIKKILDSQYASIIRNQSPSQKEISEQLVEKPSGPTLHEYLLHQLRMSFLSEEELPIAQDLIDNIDTNGYLRIPLDRFAKEHNLTLDKAEKILKTIQALDPPGIGARNLQECLLIQLKNKQKEQSLACRIIQLCFKELSRKKYALIAKKFNTDINNVKEAVKEIKSLNPKPGMIFSADENMPVIPDIIVKVRNNKFHIDFNETDLPKLKINPQYKKLLNDPATTEETKQFIYKRLKNASWLIKAMEQKQKNSLKIMQAILGTQKQAISKDLSCLRPLTLRKIANKTGLHISTVSRAVSNKYISTPQGTIRVKDLFSPGLILRTKGEISRKKALNKIKKCFFAKTRKNLLLIRWLLICFVKMAS